ncbi:MAG: ABC transporter ATP-binding protein [Deltaproteobacteria bacterium]|nr:ABC transporter ATP-binding protein [Candidatus Anaeroferrophillus wilburensis]MBN2889015.1 ABC transporter ATP-binding protein [Deltaproteobacteria bacterium]
MSSFILEAKGLNTFYDRSKILFDVDLHVVPGEVVCLMGRNGMGKTTTFRSLMGLTPPKTGQVIFKGRDVTRFPSYKMARLGLGYVPEDRRILGPFTVRENLELGRIPGRGGKWNTTTVIDAFPVLGEMTSRLGGTLSGGEQQMLTIARALMGNPDLLLLDEPTEGLSPVIVHDLKELVLKLKDAGTTILLSEQNVKFTKAVSDRVVVIDKGHVVYEGLIDEFEGEKEIQKKYLAV